VLIEAKARAGVGSAVGTKRFLEVEPKLPNTTIPFHNSQTQGCQLLYDMDQFKQNPHDEICKHELHEMEAEPCPHMRQEKKHLENKKNVYNGFFLPHQVHNGTAQAAHLV
jgi:hypothetical protein